MALSRSRRLRSRARFSQVFREGATWSSPFVVLKALPNPAGATRIGVGVGRSVGSAVLRNRAKRRLREAVCRVPLRHGWDIVLIGRPGVERVPFETLSETLQQTFRRARLLGQEDKGP